MTAPTLADMKLTLEEKETDKTWMDIDSALQHITSLYRDDPSQVPQLNRFLAQVQPAIENSIITDRTRLSGTAVALVQQMAETLQKEFLPFVDWMLPAVLKLPTKTNKVTVTRANSCLKVITQKTKLTEIIPYYLDASKSPSKTLRLSMVQQFTIIVDEFPTEDSRQHINSIESCLSEGAIDSAPEVREASRTLYTSYSRSFPDNLESFTESLSDVAKKYLQNKPKTVKPRVKPTSNFKKFMALKNEASSISANNTMPEPSKDDLNTLPFSAPETVTKSPELEKIFAGPSSGSAQLDARVNRRNISIQPSAFCPEADTCQTTNSSSSVSPRSLMSMSSSQSDISAGLGSRPLVSRNLSQSPTHNQSRRPFQSMSSRLEALSRPTSSSLAKIATPKVARASPAALSPARSHRINRTLSNTKSGPRE